jgi:hypothetical protein
MKNIFQSDKGGAELTLRSRGKHGLCRIRQPLSAIASPISALLTHLNFIW